MFWQHHVSSSPRRSQQDVADDGESPEESTASGGYGTQMRSDDVKRFFIVKELAVMEARYDDAFRPYS